MPTKTFIRANTLYHAPNRRDQNDIELQGMTVVDANDRIAIVSGSQSAGVASYNDLTDKPSIPRIDPSYFNVLDYGAKGDGVTNDTAAIQSALNACAAAGGGVVYIPYSQNTYKISGTLQTSVNGVNPNCQFYIPLIAVATKMVTITIRGGAITSFETEAFSGVERNTQGVILESTIQGTGTLPSVLGSSWGNPANVGPRNYVHVHLENIIVRTSTLSGTTNILGTMSAINMSKILRVTMKNVKADISSKLINMVTPSNETFGIIFPLINNHTCFSEGYLYAEGYKYGIVTQEHFAATYVICVGCVNGVVVDHGHHSVHIRNYAAENCIKNVLMKGDCNLYISTFNTEHGQAGGLTTTHDVYFDTSAAAVDSVNGTSPYLKTRSVHIAHFVQVTSNVGVENKFLTNNYSNVFVQKINEIDLTESIQTPASASSIAIDLLRGYNVALTLTSNTTITFSTPFVGKKMNFFVQQDGTGGRTLQLAGANIPLTGTANSRDHITGVYDGTNWLFSTRPIITSFSSSYTPNFIAAVQAAGGSLTTSEQNALSAFESSASINGYLSLLQRLFLFVGGNIAAQKLDFLGSTALTTIGCTYTATGLQTNGTSDYFNSNVIPSTHLLQNNVSFFVKMKNNTAPSVGITGCYSGTSGELPNLSMAFNIDGTNSTFVAGSTNAITTYPNPDFSKILIGTRRSSTDQQGYVDGASIGTTTTAIGVGLPTVASFGAARNTNGAQTNFIANTWQVFGFAKGMTSAQVASFNSDLKTLLTALGR